MCKPVCSRMDKRVVRHSIGRKDSKSHGMSWHHMASYGIIWHHMPSCHGISSPLRSCVSHQPFEGRDAAAFLAPPPRRPGLVVGTRAVEVRKMVDDGGEIV